MASLEQMIKKYIITTAQYNVGVNKQLLKNMEKYSAVNDAEIIILPTVGRNINEEQIMIKDLAMYRTISNDWKINNSLKVKDFGVRPQAINPLTGLERFAQGDKSYIMPGTKQVLKFISNSYDDIPKAIMTTGAITKPNYNLRCRVGRIAKEDQNYGFVVVEVKNGKYFHFRHVRSLQNGNFTDVTGRYKNGKYYKNPQPKALIVGDLHTGVTDPKHEKNTFEQIKYFGNNIDIYLHDTFNGESISHWNEGHYVKKHLLWEKQGLNLENELKITLKAINKYAKATKGTVYIVASNHDEHLYRYIDEGRFMGDKGNDLVGSKIYTGILEKHNALQYGLSLVGKIADNVEFIKRDEGHKILGVELGHHGDEKNNGGRGSPRSIEAANSKSVTAHRHTPIIIRNTYGVGTSTYLRIGYNTGYSNWVQNNGVLYSDGTIQLLNTIKGTWRY